MGHRATPLDGTYGVMIPGPGVSSGGAAGQVLAKKSNTDFDTEWVDMEVYTRAEVDALIAGLVALIEAGGGGGGGGSEEIAAELSSAVATEIGATTAVIGVTTDKAGGLVYWVVSTSATTPSVAQIKAGLMHSGAAAADSGTIAAVIGALADGVAGLTPSTGYYAHFVQEDADDLDSNVASSALFTTEALPSPLATPTLTRVSAAGAVPVQLGVSSSDSGIGYYGQLQIASDSGFSTITQTVVFFIDGESWAEALQDIGLSDPSGLYYARVRLLRDNDDGATSVTDQLGNTFNADASAWSNTVSDTISVATNELANSDGINRSQYLTTSGTPCLNFMTEIDLGALAAVRGLVECPDKFHFEVEVTGGFSGSDGAIYVGIADSGAVTSFATFLSANPGEAIPGYCARIAVGFSGSAFFRNGGYDSPTLPITLAIGDKIIIEGNRTTGVVSTYIWDASAGAMANGGAAVNSVTLSSQIPADWFAFAGGRRGTGTAATSDSGVANFGQTAFSMTPTAGYNGW